jgi:hypothetical protein
MCNPCDKQHLTRALFRSRSDKYSVYHPVLFAFIVRLKGVFMLKQNKAESVADREVCKI